VWLTNPFLWDVTRITGYTIPNVSEGTDCFHLQRSRVLTHRLLKMKSLDVGNLLPSDAASRNRRTESSATKLWPFVVLTTLHIFIDLITMIIVNGEKKSHEDHMYLLDFNFFVHCIFFEFLTCMRWRSWFRQCSSSRRVIEVFQ